MAAPAEIVETVQEVGLVYTTDQDPGIRRVRKGDFFDYVLPSGKPVEDEETLQRIRSLAIPPAYEDVWICDNPQGHLQATGKDARGRKQYRYHPDFMEARNESKFDRMIAFGRALPNIHRRMDEDLSRRGMPREKVLAAVVYLLEKSLIRVGNEEYVRTNKHYGLTTLRNRHVKIEGSELRFSFLGKSGVKHKIAIHDRRLSRVVKKVQELPGQVLFQYLDEEGCVRSVSSNDVNAYLKEISGEDFTAKDFRTWAGTVLALTNLIGVEEPPATKKMTKAAITAAVKEVAKELGNTPSVCRKCYIHPAVLEAFSNGDLIERMSGVDLPEEALVVRLLEGKADK